MKAKRRKTIPAGPEVRYVQGLRIPLDVGVSCRLHEHPTLEIVYHRLGQGITRLGDGREVAFTEGSCVLYAPGVPHDQVMAAPGIDLCVQVAAPAALRAGLGDCAVVPIGEKWLEDELDHLSRTPDSTDDAYRAILNHRATALLLALRRAAFRAVDATPPEELRVRRAERYLRRHFAEITSLAEVAAHLGLSADRLRHIYKARRGHSLVAFLNQVRIEHAQSLLVHTGLPLKQVATLSGFRDEYYFSSVFRRQTGQPPGAYRLARTGKLEPNV